MAEKNGVSESTPTDQEHSDSYAAVGGLMNWEFLRESPTTDRVLELLRTLPDPYDAGVSYVDFADFVQALPQSKKVKVPNPDRPGTKMDQYLDTWSLYMTVAGRIAMLNRIADANGWRVDIAQDWMDDGRESGRIVLREVIRIWDNQRQNLGVRSGIAHVPYKGGQGAAGSNPYSRVETAARGRAIAAWGIGVLPGSGVASVEEMQTVDDNQRAAQREARQAAPELGHDDLLAEVKTSMAKIRQMRDMDEPAVNAMIGKRLTDLGVRSVYDEEAQQIDWAKPNDGQLALLLNDLHAHIQNLQNQGAEL